MADHFVSLSRGRQGNKYSDFTVNTVSTAGDTIEIRVTDTTMTVKDVMVALESFENFFGNSQQNNAFVFLNN